jgi:hypothetical protein
MNNKNWLLIGVVVLVALGVWFYFDSREDVGLGPPHESSDDLELQYWRCRLSALDDYAECKKDCGSTWNPLNLNCHIGCIIELQYAKEWCEDTYGHWGSQTKGIVE